jgi:hypothetical protein
MSCKYGSTDRQVSRLWASQLADTQTIWVVRQMYLSTSSKASRLKS